MDVPALIVGATQTEKPLHIYVCILIGLESKSYDRKSSVLIFIALYLKK